MPKVTLTKANTNDIETIARLAHLIWNQHYPAIIGQTQVNYMLKLMYSHQSLQEQFIKKKHQFFLIQHNNATIGFVSVAKQTGNSWFLNKFYVNQTKASKGIGSSAFNSLLSIISPKKIALTVNRLNYKSINFYFKLGFKITKVADFDIGKGYKMNDFVMEWGRG